MKRDAFSYIGWIIAQAGTARVRRFGRVYVPVVAAEGVGALFPAAFMVPDPLGRRHGSEAIGTGWRAWTVRTDFVYGC